MWAAIYFAMLLLVAWAIGGERDGQVPRVTLSRWDQRSHIFRFWASPTERGWRNDIARGIAWIVAVLVCFVCWLVWDTWHSKDKRITEWERRS